MSGKKIAIIYKSLTGNTRQVAEAIRDALGGEEIVYFGEPKPDIVADLYFVDPGRTREAVMERLVSI